MGVDLYIRSLHDPATAKLLPLFEIAVARRDAAYETAKQALLAAGTLPEKVDELTRQDENVQTEQRTVAMIHAAWNSVEAGCFRDAYNRTSLLSMFDLADLRLFANKEKTVVLSDALRDLVRKLGQAQRWDLFTTLLDKDNLLQPPQAKVLLELLATNEPVFYDRLDNFIEYWKAACGEELTPAEAAEWTGMFEGKYTDLKRFLNKAIELIEPVVVSY